MNSKEFVKWSIDFQCPECLPFTGSMAETDFSGDTVAVFLTWVVNDGLVEEVMMSGLFLEN